MKMRLIRPAALGVALVALCLTGSPAEAQQPQTTNPKTPTNNTRFRTLSNVLFTMTRSSGIAVVSDSFLTDQSVPPPPGEVTATNLEDSISTLVQSLPAGTVWAKLYLPEPKGNRGFNGDAVAEYALAQAKLFGNVGGATPEGTIEVMGQKISADKVPAVTAALNLKPVYVLVNTNKKPGEASTAGATNWATMTPDEQKQAAQQQAQQLMNMDPTARAAYFQQQRAVMESMMQSLSPQQRAELFRNMGGSGGERGNRGNRGNRGGGQNQP